MDMDDLKRDEIAKEKSLALKASYSDESKRDEEQLSFITKNFKRFLNKKEI